MAISTAKRGGTWCRDLGARNQKFVLQSINTPTVDQTRRSERLRISPPPPDTPAWEEDAIWGQRRSAAAKKFRGTRKQGGRGDDHQERKGKDDDTQHNKRKEVVVSRSAHLRGYRDLQLGAVGGSVIGWVTPQGEEPVRRLHQELRPGPHCDRKQRVLKGGAFVSV